MKHVESTPPEGRDQAPTTFAAILQELLWHEPRATAAVLIDPEGETVDYASALSSYYTKVAAANLRVVLDEIAESWRRMLPGDPLAQIILRARRQSFFVRPLPDGYALALVLRHRAFTVSSRAVALAACRLAREAGWSAPPEETLPWHPADVETSRAGRFRPLQMKTGDTWEPVEVLGSVVGRAGDRSRVKEKGYRCRLQGGAEITLVRETTGIWFADQPPRGLSSQLGPPMAAPADEPSRPPSPRSKAPPAASSKVPSAPSPARPAKVPPGRPVDS